MALAVSNSEVFLAIHRYESRATPKDKKIQVTYVHIKIFSKFHDLETDMVKLEIRKKTSLYGPILSRLYISFFMPDWHGGTNALTQ